MKINSIQIGAFGKLKNVSMDFADGFQIITAKNEYGKSTIMAFIKLMFYGKGTSSRDISINLRKKYAPWDGTKMSGAIEFSYNDSDYRLEKEFAKTASSDKVVIINKLNGERILLAKEEEAGMKFFQMDSTGFEKSIFIANIGGFTGNGDKDSIAVKISNLTAAADEEISAELVMKRLTDAKENLISKSGKAGELIRIREEMDAVQYNLNELLESEKQREDERIQYRKMKNSKKQLELELELVQDKIRLQKLEEVIECENCFRSIWKKMECLQIPYEQLEEFFIKCGNLYITIEHDKKQLERLPDIAGSGFTEQKNNELNLLETELHTISKMMIYTEKERNNAEQVLDKLERESEKKKKEWQGLQEHCIKLKQRTEQFDIEEAERRREQLHLQAVQKRQSRECEREKKGIHRYIAWAAGGCFVFAALVLELFYRAYPAAAITASLIVIGIILSAGIRKRMNNTKRIELEAQDFESELYSRISELDKSISVYRKNREEYLKQDVQLQLLGKQLEQDKARKLETEEQKKELEAQILTYRKKNQDIMIGIQTICKEAGCLSEKEYHQEFVKYKAVLEQKQKIEEKLTEQRTMFQKFFPYLPDGSPFTDYLNHYLDKKEHYEKAVREKARYEMLLKAYELEETKLDAQIDEQIRLREKSEQLKECIKSGIAEEASLTELDRICGEPDIKQLNGYQELLRERIRRMEAAIRKAGEQLRPAGQNPLSIERKLRDLKQSETDMSQYYEAVSAADKMMEETVQQIRQSFGNELNDKTGAIFKEITGGKYENVIVNKDYGMLVSDSDDIRYREWKYLSSGTIDQLYLALRLAITQCITDTGERLPLFLDDILAQYDEERAGQTIKFLKKFGLEHQIILFTCHNYFNNLLEAD